MLLNSHISAYARCIAGKVCGLVRSTWGASQGEDKPGARDKMLNTKVARRGMRRVRAGQTFLRGCACVCLLLQKPNLMAVVFNLKNLARR